MERPVVLVDRQLRKRGLAKPFLAFVQAIPEEQREWWDRIVFRTPPESPFIPKQTVEVEFVRDMLYQKTPVTERFLCEGGVDAAKSLEKWARLCWNASYRTVTGTLAEGEPPALVYGWNEP